MPAEVPIRLSAPWDRDHVVVTGFVTTLCSMGAVLTGWAAFESPDATHRWLALIGFAVCVGTPLLAWLFAPVGFSVGPGTVTVHRRLWTLRFDGVTDARPVDAVVVHGAYRIFGSGGAFGTYGRFRHRLLGKFRLYARREAGMIAFSSRVGTVVISPSDPEAALRALAVGRPGT
jgi:hypothetical protein